MQFHLIKATYVFHFTLLLISTIALGQNINTSPQTNNNSLKEFSEKTSISGQWFLSYQNGNKSGKAFNYFLIKRGYINFKHQFSESFAGRITPDISVDHEGDGYGDIELRLKYCYVKYNLKNSSFFTKPFFEIGLAHRPWLDFEQHINLYRAQDKLFLEKIDLINSADFGVTFMTLLGGEMDDSYKKQINKNYAGRYGSLAVGVYNGGGYHAVEENLNKSVEGRLTIRPLPYIIPGLQISYNGVIGKGNIESEPEWKINSFFLSWENYRAVLTALYYFGKGNFSGKMLDNSKHAFSHNGYSLFGDYRLFNRQYSIIARYDYFKQNFQTNNTKRLILGIARHLVNGSKIIIDIDVLKDNDNKLSDNTVAECVFEIDF